MPRSPTTRTDPSHPGPPRRHRIDGSHDEKASVLGRGTSTREELDATRISMARHVARSRALGADDALAGSESASAADLLLELHRRSAPGSLWSPRGGNA